jgi:E3 ubiquitin-protein ligase RNF216
LGSLNLLQHAFRHSYASDVQAVFRAKGQKLFPAYLEIDERVNGEPGRELPHGRKRYPGKERPEYREDLIEARIRVSEDATEKSALEEYLAAVQFCRAKRQEKDHEKQVGTVAIFRERPAITDGSQLAQAEIDNFMAAQLEGATAECGCCFDEFALNRMVHCDGSTFHYFCKECSRQMAEHQIGQSKYELTCMSMDGCKSSFTQDQRAIFINENAEIALGRLEQEAMLRLAGIESLETCPFCPFAMEYPPVEENKEFQCENPECGQRSCRLCREETHIPRTCEEAGADHGSSARRIIEEAMSAALIRKCNKCKLDGSVWRGPNPPC